MFGHRTSDFTSVSLNIFHASQTICKRSAANVLIFKGKRAMLILFYTGFVKRSSVFFARQKKSSAFFTKKSMCCSAKITLPLSFFGSILEQCIFYTGLVKRSSAKQNGCCGDEDALEVSTKKNTEFKESKPELITDSPVEQNKLDDDTKNTYCQEGIDWIEGEEKPLARDTKRRESAIPDFRRTGGCN